MINWYIMFLQVLTDLESGVSPICHPLVPNESILLKNLEYPCNST